MKLLSNSSAKLDKSQNEQYINYIMYLNPEYSAKVCPNASKACKTSCLINSGRLRMENVRNAMDERTALYFNDKDLFMNILKGEISSALYHAQKEGKKLAIRLNGTSDLNFTSIYKEFDQVQFYEYTKSPKLAKLYKEISNVHYTFSRNEKTKLEDIKELIAKGINVAVVFDDRNALPNFWNEIKVIDGDKHDRRFEDEKGVIIGLKLKGTNAIKSIARSSDFAI